MLNLQNRYGVIHTCTIPLKQDKLGLTSSLKESKSETATVFQLNISYSFTVYN